MKRNLQNRQLEVLDSQSANVCSKSTIKTLEQDLYPAGIYLFKMNNETTRTMCEICSGVSIVDFEELNTEAVTGGVLK